MVTSNSFQDAIIDKDTGLPLAGGVVTFYRDSQRSLLKTVWIQTGSPDHYTFQPVPNPLILSAAGTPEYLNQDFVPFFYPWDENDDTAPDPYYITVDNSQGERQFTRQRFPWVPVDNSEDVIQQDIINFIPNGQFAAHTNLVNNAIPNDPTDLLIVAPGGAVGWYYQKNNPSTSTDLLSFNYLGTTSTETETLTGSPRYAVVISCINPSSDDTFKEFRMRFSNVNHFANESTYTVSLSAQNLSTGTIPVGFHIYKFFGTGGNPSDPVSSIPITVDFGNLKFSTESIQFQFGSNQGYNIGTNNDDYVELVFSFPATDTFSVQMTNFLLTPGAITINDYPQRPDNDVFANGIAGSMPIPNPDGSDLYLPIILGKGGFRFDNSDIGKIYPTLSTNLASNEWYLDGSQKYTGDYSDSGIPNSRLFNVLWNNGVYGNVPRFGTGANWVTAYIPTVGTAGTIYLSSNNYPTAAPPDTANAPSVPWTFTTLKTSLNVAPSFKAFRNGIDGLLMISNTSNSSTPPTTVVATIASALTTSPFSWSLDTTAIANNQPNMQPYFSVNSIDAATLSATTIASAYVGFNFPTTGSIWFTVDGVGTNPAIGTSQISVPLAGTDAAADVTYKILSICGGGYLSRAVCTYASAIANGQFFTFGTADSKLWAAYYIKDNAVVPPPNIVNTTAFPINILGTDTAAMVAQKTMIAINKYSYSLPSAEGLFLRGVDPTGALDRNSLRRLSYGNNASYNSMGNVYPGTFQLDSLQSHSHSIGMFTGSGGNSITTSGGSSDTPTIYPPQGRGGDSNLTGVVANGSAETVSKNIAVNWVIKY